MKHNKNAKGENDETLDYYSEETSAYIQSSNEKFSQSLKAEPLTSILSTQINSLPLDQTIPSLLVSQKSTLQAKESFTKLYQKLLDKLQEHFHYKIRKENVSFEELLDIYFQYVDQVNLNVQRLSHMLAEPPQQYNLFEQTQYLLHTVDYFHESLEPKRKVRKSKRSKGSSGNKEENKQIFNLIPCVHARLNENEDHINFLFQQISDVSIFLIDKPIKKLNYNQVDEFVQSLSTFTLNPPENLHFIDEEKYPDSNVPFIYRTHNLLTNYKNKLLQLSSIIEKDQSPPPDTPIPDLLQWICKQVSDFSNNFSDIFNLLLGQPNLQSLSSQSYFLKNQVVNYTYRSLLHSKGIDLNIISQKSLDAPIFHIFKLL